MATLHAEVEYIKRSIVKVNIDKLLASDWVEDRGEYNSDEALAKGVVQKIGYYDLLDPSDEDEFGISVEGDYDEGEIKDGNRITTATVTTNTTGSVNLLA